MCWALLFAAPHTWWALGVSAGFPGGEAKYRFFMTSTWRYVYDLVVVVLSALADWRTGVNSCSIPGSV
jgi:hypothetical protein